MGKRCQVCDGPIVGGRCRSCGMPYRNDEELYHLNENKSDHYAHASAKARTIMDRNEVPLPDRGGRAAAGRRANTAYGKRTTGKAYQNGKTGGAGSKLGILIWGGIILLYIIITWLAD